MDHLRANGFRVKPVTVNDTGVERDTQRAKHEEEAAAAEIERLEKLAQEQARHPRYARRLPYRSGRGLCH